MSGKSGEISPSDSSNSVGSTEDKPAAGDDKRDSQTPELTMADLVSPPASPRALHAAEENEKEEQDANFVYRTNIVRELHKTEQFYVKGLTSASCCFLSFSELVLTPLCRFVRSDAQGFRAAAP